MLYETFDRLFLPRKFSFGLMFETNMLLADSGDLVYLIMFRIVELCLFLFFKHRSWCLVGIGYSLVASINIPRVYFNIRYLVTVAGIQYSAMIWEIYTYIFLYDNKFFEDRWEYVRFECYDSGIVRRYRYKQFGFGVGEGWDFWPYFCWNPISEMKSCVSHR